MKRLAYTATATALCFFYIMKKQPFKAGILNFLPTPVQSAGCAARCNPSRKNENLRAGVIVPENGAEE